MKVGRRRYNGIQVAIFQFIEYSLTEADMDHLVDYWERANVNREEIKELEAKIKQVLSEEVGVHPKIIWCPAATLEKALI